MAKPAPKTKGTAPPAEKAKREPIDWDRIEPEFRAGIKSVLQIAADYQKATGRAISHTAINKHFKELGITRDLKAKVQAKAEALVSAAAVSAKVATETAATTPTEAAIINANADMVATVMLSQRGDIRRNRTLAIELLRELENQTFSQDLFEQLGELVIGPPILGSDPEDRAAERRRLKLIESFERTMSLPSRIDGMKKLADTLKVLVALEREAYGIGGDDGKGGGSYEDFLDEI